MYVLSVCAGVLTGFMISSARLAYNQNHKVNFFHDMQVYVTMLRKKRRKRPEEILRLRAAEIKLNELLENHEPPYSNRKTLHYSSLSATLVTLLLFAITYCVNNV